MDIRRLCYDDPTDLSRYRAVRLDALRINPEAFAYSFEHEDPQNDEFFRAHLKQAHMFGAFLDGQLVGIGKLAPDSLPKRTYIGFIGSVFVYPEYRGKRIGRILCEQIVQQATELGLTQLELIVTCSQDSAIGLYRALGFVECGRMPTAIRVGDDFFDALYMSKRLG